MSRRAEHRGLPEGDPSRNQLLPIAHLPATYFQQRKMLLDKRAVIRID